VLRSVASSSFDGARVATPNLLGRPLVTVRDVEDAYEAIAVAAVRRAEISARIEQLASAPAATAAVGAAAAAGADSEEEVSGDDDDDGGDGSDGSAVGAGVGAGAGAGGSNGARVLVVHD
jgi:hypothetical protein